MKSKNIIQSKYKNVTCPKCNFNKIKKDGLRKTQKRDKIKKQYCLDNGINFLEIPYTEFDNIEEILSNYLEI